MTLPTPQYSLEEVLGAYAANFILNHLAVGTEVGSLYDCSREDTPQIWDHNPAKPLYAEFVRLPRKRVLRAKPETALRRWEKAILKALLKLRSLVPNDGVRYVHTTCSSAILVNGSVYAIPISSAPVVPIAPRMPIPPP